MANAQRLADSGAEVIAVPADISSAGERRELVQTVERRLGPVDVLDNNAGGDLQREFHNLSEDEVRGILELNLTSAVLLTRLVLPSMLDRGRGHEYFCYLRRRSPGVSAERMSRERVRGTERVTLYPKGSRLPSP